MPATEPPTAPPTIAADDGSMAAVFVSIKVPGSTVLVIDADVDTLESGDVDTIESLDGLVDISVDVDSDRLAVAVDIPDVTSVDDIVIVV